MYENLVNSSVVAPLVPLIGQTLKAVNYYILWYGDSFDPEKPNECGGCQGVHLIFDKSEVELDWDYRPEFRGGDRGIALHLTTSACSRRREGLREWVEDDVTGFRLTPASETRLWKSLIGEPVVRIELLGEHLDEARCSPQAVGIYFASSSVVITIGMTGCAEPPVPDVGDGDELLVFGGQEWAALPEQGVRGSEVLLCCWEWPE